MKKLLAGLFLLFCIGLANGESITFPNVGTTALAPGRQLSVTADAGDVLVQRFNGPTLIETVTVSASGTTTFGEYFIREQFKIIPLSGAASYSDSQSTSAISVATATSATTAGTVTTAAQPAITSVGILTGVNTSGHIKGAGLPTIGASDCGTTGTVVGSDNGMTVTVGSGGSATSCLVTFHATWTTAPACIAQSNTDLTALSMATTATTLTVTKTAAFTAASKLNIICLGF